MAFKTSLLISTYNWPEALELVLKSVLRQTKLPDEILIADDGSNQKTQTVIYEYKSYFSIPLKHAWHPDEGFRKTIIMNEAVRISTGNYIIQIDGDIILHPEFINDHLQQAAPGYFIKGSRGMLNKALTDKLIATKSTEVELLVKGLGSRINATRMPGLSFLFYGDTKKTNDLRGCNFAFWKDDFIAVNGYNNDLKGWGHEDIELAARLVNAGIKRRQLKMVAVCYHLYHSFNSRQQEDTNYNQYLEAVDKRKIMCINGYRQS